MKNVIAISVLMFSLFSCRKEVSQPGLTNSATSNSLSTNPSSLSDLSVDLSVNQVGNLIMGTSLNNITFDSVWSEQYHFNVYDSCAAENIRMSGLETYYLKQSPYVYPDYYIYYIITLTGVTGTGEISGVKYNGKGITGGVTKSSDRSLFDTTYFADGSYVITPAKLSTKTAGYDIYNFKYVSERDEITMYSKNVYKERNGVVIVDQTGNPIIIECKTY
jgi:hypothetical protein